MNMLDEISDDEFIPFLQSLGVETYKKSFEWMLTDKNYSGVLRWLYQNLDHNNALSAREEYRYAELKKLNHLLPLEDLENAIEDLKNEYEGLCLPGDKELAQDIQFDINMQKERLHMLQKQEEVLKDLLKQNELTREELIKDVSKLHSAEQQHSEDESNLSQECLQLADEVENITEEVMTVVADTLDMYSDCCGDKDISKKFFTYGPYDAYRQTQVLYRSHFDLYTTKKFSSGFQDAVTNDDLQAALLEAKSMEERLTDAMLAFIESKAELSGEQAKVALVTNYTVVHPSQIASSSLEAQSALDLLEQEEAILDQQVQSAVKDLVDSRTKLAVDTTAKAALVVREQVHKDLTFLLENTHQALALDRLLYSALRNELRTMQELVQFAAHLRQYVITENGAVVSRIESMKQICSEQQRCEQHLETSDSVIDTLSRILGLPNGSDATVLAKAYSDLCNNITELKEAVDDAFVKKETALKEFSTSAGPIRAYVYDGSTRLPNCWDQNVSSLSHSLKQLMDETDKKVLHASGLFTSVKTGDKHHLRKLWQWFITDPNKLAAALRGVQGKSFS